MGIRLPDSKIDIGVDCAACYLSQGGFFEPGKQPKFLYVTFAGVIQSQQPHCLLYPPLPNGHIFTLEQTEFDPCRYYYERDPWKITVQFRIPGHPYPVVQVWSFQGYGYFYAQNTEAESCNLTHPNGLIEEQFLYCGLFGFASISFRKQLIDTASSLGIPLSRTTFAESFAVDDDHTTQKFCNRRDGTNIKIKLNQA